MGTKSKATQLGNYITKVNGYDIRQKVTYKKDSKNPQVASSELIVCKGKRTVKGGFKNIESAKEFANAQ